VAHEPAGANLVRVPNCRGAPTFYELRHWLWEHNRNGFSNEWNPKLRCA
jgi:hypothetical protein